MVNYSSLFEEQKNLEQRLIYGYYPEVVLKKAESLDLIKNLTSSYLFKDIFSLEGVKKTFLTRKTYQGNSIANWQRSFDK